MNRRPARRLGRAELASRIVLQRLSPYDVAALMRLSRDPTSRKAGIEILLAGRGSARTGEPWKTCLAVLFAIDGGGDVSDFDAMLAEADAQVAHSKTTITTWR